MKRTGITTFALLFCLTFAVLLPARAGDDITSQKSAGHGHSPARLESNKCPVCGMSTAKFSDWNGRVEFKDSSAAIFDGPKCTFKYYLDIKKSSLPRDKDEIASITVKDYYSKAPIDARQAYYVIWGDLYGPMGHEPIPFQKKSDATKYFHDHKGKEMVRFQDITPELIQSLDNPKE